MNRFRRAMKALTGSPLPRSGRFADSWDSLLRIKTPTDEDFNRALTNADQSSLVMGCIDYAVANIGAMPLVVYQDREMLTQHPVLDLLASPTPSTTWESLLSGWIISLGLSGNAWALLTMTRGGDVGEIQYVPHTAMEVGTNARGQLTHYVYRYDGHEVRYEIEEVIHIRRSQDWKRPHYGASPLAALGAEIWLDFEATRVVATLLKNRGMPGGIISPSAGDQFDEPMSDEDLQATRRYMREQFGGNNRGNWLVLGEPMDINLINYDPRVLDMSKAWFHAEARVARAFGYQPTVLGLGSGVSQSKVGTATTAFERQAWQDGHIPTMQTIAKQVTKKLLAEEDVTLGFDLSGVNVLQEDENAKALRWTTMVQGGYALVSDAKEAQGLEVAETDKVYLRAVSLEEIPFGESEESRMARMASMRPNPGEEKIEE